MNSYFSLRVKATLYNRIDIMPKRNGNKYVCGILVSPQSVVRFRFAFRFRFRFRFRGPWTLGSGGYWRRWNIRHRAVFALRTVANVLETGLRRLQILQGKWLWRRWTLDGIQWLFLLRARQSGCPQGITLAGIVVVRRQVVLPYEARLVIDHWILAVRIRWQMHRLASELRGQWYQHGRQSLLIQRQWHLLLGHLLALHGSGWRRRLRLLLHWRLHRLLGFIWSIASGILGGRWQRVREL